MIAYVVTRILSILPMLFLISLVAFLLIQLPPGDFLTAYIAQTGTTDELLDDAVVEMLRRQYGLDRPLHVQYLTWAAGFFRGDFGYSFEWGKPVADLIGDRLFLTMVISMSTIVFTWILAIPVGVLSAVKQYSVADHVLTVIGFLGLAIPNFLLALVLMYGAFRFFGMSVGGLFSPEFVEAPWSLARVRDLIAHLWIPIIVIGTSGTASIIRIMRGNLLDELRKQYVITARAKGLGDIYILFKYPVRVALNPLVSSIAWLFPSLISGTTITAVVLSLPTSGPLLLRSLLSQDMYLAGTFVMMLAFMTVIGTLVSDLLLAWVDPRIRFEARSR